mmetsp:Transcript_27352/g.78831  ORF Transcript_27352/g.78831 Transcript_27352/m.78831 type:complete len:218 (-) Transcript_27352:1651-2304(-)
MMILMMTNLVLAPPPTSRQQHPLRPPSQHLRHLLRPFWHGCRAGMDRSFLSCRRRRGGHRPYLVPKWPRALSSEFFVSASDQFCPPSGPGCRPFVRQVQVEESTHQMKRGRWMPYPPPTRRHCISSPSAMSSLRVISTLLPRLLLLCRRRIQKKTAPIPQLPKAPSRYTTTSRLPSSLLHLRLHRISKNLPSLRRSIVTSYPNLSRGTCRLLLVEGA